jgi:hypothetical protein
MPSRPSHLPNHRERTALLLLRAQGELPLKKLHPTGLSTVNRMLEKAWVVRVGSETYRITPAGEAALKMQLPDYRKNDGARATSSGDQGRLDHSVQGRATI